MNPNIVHYGSPDPLPATVSLRAGKLELRYEDGFLRYIRQGSTEIIRMINHVVRDHDWDTVPMTITNEEISDFGDAFLVTYTATCQQEDVHMVWHCKLEGNKDSSILFEIKGKAMADFRKNRAGFTVLHPVEPCSGKACQITHANSALTAGVFPDFISASQPFMDIKAISWEPKQGIKVQLSFEGDVFEMEDQRNWIDASYKTYCTPLALPFPVQLVKGEEIFQKVSLKVMAHSLEKVSEEESKGIVLDRKAILPFPKLGIPISELPHHPYMRNRLKTLRPDFLRVELDTSRDIRETLENAVYLTREIGCKLQVVLFFDRSPKLDALKEVEPYKELILHFIVLPLYRKSTDQELLDGVLPYLRSSFPKARIGAGTDAFFKELNDAPPPTKAIDFLNFSINPQVHAFDLASLTETLSAHRYVVRSGKRIAGEKGIHVGPVTFHMRWNPNATSDQGKGMKADGSQVADPRQTSLYGAAWTLISFKYLAESETECISYYQTCGQMGLMSHPEDPWPEKLGIDNGSAYPLFSILKTILGHKKGHILRLTSRAPLLFDGLALQDEENGISVLLANFTNRPQDIPLAPQDVPKAIKILDIKNVLFLYENRLDKVAETLVKGNTVQLPPFALGVFHLGQ